MHNKKVAITGATGFLGSYVSQELQNKGYHNLFLSGSKDYDLTTKKGVHGFFNHSNPDIIIHLAAVVGGIGANSAFPGSFFYKNAIMGIRMMEHARLRGIEKFVALGTICAYPKFTPAPFKEEDLWTGYPEETNAPYGLAKKMMLVQAQAYRKQYDFNAIYLLPVNLYGPRDNFKETTSNVIPALIKKCIDAKENKETSITVWGTGKASREFLYAADAARGIILAMEHYNKPDPVNLGSGEEITIDHLVTKIAAATDFQGQILWDSTKPDGQPRRLLDTSKARDAFGFTATTSLDQGLDQTIQWYIQHIHPTR